MPFALNLWVLVTREEGLPGWGAHVLDLDVVTQGDTLDHAVAMAEEAAAMTLADDLARGLDPLRRRAPPADWEALHQIQREGTPSHRAWFTAPAHEEGLIAAALRIRATVKSVVALDNLWAQRAG